MYTLFDELLRRLSKLSARRRLFDDETQNPPLDESFEAAQILGQITSWLYDDGLTPQSKGVKRRTLLETSGSMSTDHTQFVYLKPIGKVHVKAGKKKVRCCGARTWMGFGSVLRAFGYPWAPLGCGYAGLSADT
jgi:hypothetical protein